MIRNQNNILFLFDIDGTLCDIRCKAPKKIIDMLLQLKTKVNIGFVGGSDLQKQKEQIGENILDIFHYGFPENGLQYFKDGILQNSKSIIEFLGEDNFKKLINNILLILSNVDCPKKRGLFIETRNSMVNISPIGRSCNYHERLEFFEFDKKHNIRKEIILNLKNITDELNLVCSIGGQISIDIFPKGWDKTYCLNYVEEQIIYFFGDRIQPGGNDYEIYHHPRINGIYVNGPNDTIQKVNEILKTLNLI